MAEWLRENFQWLKDDGVDKGQKLLQGMKFGADLARQRRTDDLTARKMFHDQELAEKEYELKKQSFDFRNRLFDIQEKARVEKAAGLTAIGETLAKWSGKLDEPEAEAEFWSTARRFPSTMDDASFNQLATIFQRTRDYKDREDAAKARRPVAMQNAEAVTRLESEASALEATGDITGATAKRREAKMLEASLLSGAESIAVGTDETGRPIVRIDRGAAAGRSGTGAVTAGTQSKLEQDLINTRKSLDLISDLKQNLSWRDVGVAGVVGETVLDKTLPQLGISSFDAKRTDNRTKLKMLVQGVLRQISPDNRFTNEDRERVEAITPSTGIFENEEHAKRVLKVMERVFAKRNIRDLQEMGKPITLKGLNDAEIGAAVEMNLIPFNDAKEFLMQRLGGE